MKTTWLSQLKQSVRPTAQGLVSACALPSTLTVNAAVAGSVAAVAMTDRSIANIINELNTRINLHSKQISNTRSQLASFKTYSTPYSRIRREDLQVAGAS